MRPLWNHQVHGIRVAEVVPDLGLFYEQGTGKSRTTVEILRRRYAKAARLMRTVIFAPVIVCPNWQNEFAMYSKINPRDVVVLSGSQKNRIKQFLYHVGDTLEGSKIFVTNYESCQMDDLFNLILKWKPEILVCDESQRVKNPTSIRAKKVAMLADQTQHNYILTGTPILNSPMDIYMQFRILDRGATFGKNFFAFRGMFFEDKNARMNKQNYFPKWEARADAYQSLQYKIKSKALRVLKKDCLDLPPYVRQVVHVPMSPTQAKMYREMYNDYITFIDNHRDEPRAVVANLAVVKATKLQQIVSGFAKDDSGVCHRIADCPRLSVLTELLGDIAVHSKVIVWSHYKENQRMVVEVCEKLGLGYAEIHGDIKDKEHQMNKFRKDSECRVMVANQAAGGVGVNLVEASYAIYYGKGFKLEDDEQSEARNYRGGSEVHEKVTRIDLVTPGSIDELVNESLLNKKNVSETILGWRDKYVTS